MSACISSFYPRKDYAENNGEPERRLPVYGTRPMKTEVPQQSHDAGNNESQSEHGYEINEKLLDVHFSAFLRTDVLYSIRRSWRAILRDIFPRIGVRSKFCGVLVICRCFLGREN